MANICIDLGGTNIKAGIIEQNNLLIEESVSAQSAESFDALMDGLNLLIQDLLKRQNILLNDLNGIGICMPGIIDIHQKKVISINEKHVGAINFDFIAWAKSNFGSEIVLENDARAALAGEWQFGTGKGYNHIAMMTIGTGIGGAAMIDGKLLYGKHYQGGCLGGHFTVNLNGNLCTCGNKGCVESEASSWKLAEVLQQPKHKKLMQLMNPSYDYQTLFSLKRSGNKLANEIVSHHLHAWAAGIVNLIHAYDPQIVIISGGVMNSKDDILPFIEDYVKNHAWTPSHKVEIKASEETDTIALWGMNYLINKNEYNAK